MRTPNGTPYRVLRQLARRHPPSVDDCLDAERDARQAVRNGARHALQSLLIARALWSAWRARHVSPSPTFRSH